MPEKINPSLTQTFSRTNIQETSRSGISKAPPVQPKENKQSQAPVFLQPEQFISTPFQMKSLPSAQGDNRTLKPFPLVAGKTVQRVLEVDGKPINSLEDINVEELLNSSKFRRQKAFLRDLLIQVIKEFINDTGPAHKMTQGELVEAAEREYRKMLSEGPGSSENKSEINNSNQQSSPEALRVLSEEGITLNRSGFLREENGQALQSFLKEDPLLMEKIRLHQQSKELTTINFGSNEAKSYGGGLYKDSTISFTDIISGHTTETFMQFFLHELGHATFQNFLEGDQKITELQAEIKELQIRKAAFVATSYSISSSQKEKNSRRLGMRFTSTPNLEQQVLLEEKKSKRKGIINPEETISSSNNSETEIELEKIENQIKSKELLIEYYTTGARLKVDLDKANKILMSYGTKYFFGTQMGEKTPEDRRDYQKKINEFYAESFMHITYHEEGLKAHIQTLQQDKDTPEEVIAAWQTILQILLQYKYMSLGLNTK